jgi:hypothetical protein
MFAIGGHVLDIVLSLMLRERALRKVGHLEPAAVAREIDPPKRFNRFRSFARHYDGRIERSRLRTGDTGYEDTGPLR